MRELRAMAGALSSQEFREQLGPIALIEQHESLAAAVDPVLASGEVGPTSEVLPERIMARMLSLALAIEELRVTSLPPLGRRAELSVGRQPDCDLVIDHHSVSKRHALLRWDEGQQCCTLCDLGSTNGTFVNAITRIEREVVLADGDIVGFGEIAFWFLLAESLHAKLSEPTGAPDSV
jgi:hypothetical protein